MTGGKSMRSSGAKRLAFATMAVAALAAVFLSYLQPDLAVDLASRLWACF